MRASFSAHVLFDACRRLGVSIHQGRVRTPTDRPTIERTFRSIRQLLEHLPGYKGANLRERGADVKEQPLMPVSELESIFAEWIATCWQRRPHDGLRLAACPAGNSLPTRCTSTESHGRASCGCRPSSTCISSCCRVEWRKVRHDGVELAGSCTTVPL